MTKPKSFPRKGEIYYVRLPNQPSDPHQPRVAIVVSRDSRNANASDVLVVPAFSNTNIYSDTYVTIPKDEGGMPHNSTAKCDQVSAIDKSLIADGPLGDRINQSLMWKIHYAIRRALGEQRVP